MVCVGKDLKDHGFPSTCHFHGLCICFFVLGLTNSFLFSHANLLPFFYDIFLLIASSHTLWKTSLKICQFCSTPLSLRAVTQGILLNISLKSWNFAFVKFAYFSQPSSLRAMNSPKSGSRQPGLPPNITSSLCEFMLARSVTHPLW